MPGREHVADRAVQALDVGPAYPRRRQLRMDLRRPQRLVGVDVAEPGDDALVEQDGLDRRLAPAQRRVQELGRERVRERLGAEPEREERGDAPRRRAAAPTSRSGGGRCSATSEPSSSSSSARSAARRLLARAASQEVAGHPQVDGQRLAVVEPQQQVLAAALDALDREAREGGRDRARAARGARAARRRRGRARSSGPRRRGASRVRTVSTSGSSGTGGMLGRDHERPDYERP